MNILSYKYVLFLLFLLSVTSVKSQNAGGQLSPVVSGTLRGVDDFETVPYLLAGANVKVTCLGDTTQVFNGVTDGKGDFWIEISTKKELKDQRVRVLFTYVGMEPLDTIVEPKGEYIPVVGVWMRPSATLRDLVMKAKPVTMEETVIIGELKKMYMSGDTVVFNTEAYEMPSGSVLLELVRRLPGLMYADGKLTYFGRSIDEIRMNGDTFFKHDISIALKNMPNDKLRKLKVYETVSDTLNMNSNKHLVMDMETDKPYTKAYFCNALAATDEKLDGYELEGEVHSFLKNLATYSLRAQMDELASVYTMADKRTYACVSGFASLERKRWRLDFQPDYFYDDIESRREVLTQMFMPDFTQYSVEKDVTLTTEKRGRGQFNANGIAGKHLRWSVNGDVKIAEDRTSSANGHRMYSDNPFSGEGHDELLGEELLNPLRLNESEASSQTLVKDKSMTWKGKLARSFSEANSELGLSVGLAYHDREMTVHDVTETRYFRFEDSVSLYNRMMSTPEDRLELNADVYFNKRFGKKNRWGVSYSLDYDEEKRKERYYDVTGAPGGAVEFDADVMGGLSLVDSLSYRNRNRTLRNKLAANLTMCWGGLELKAAFGIQPTRLSMRTGRYGGEMTDTTYTATLLSPSMSLSYGKGNKIVRLFYSGEGGMPPNRNLLAVTDYSDPLNVRSGNADLKNIFRHKLIFEAGDMKTRLVSTLDVTDNAVRMRTVYDSETGVRHTSPDNIGGNWSVRTSVERSCLVFNQNLTLKAAHYYSREVDYVQRAGDVASAKGVTHGHAVDLSAGMFYSGKKLTGMFNISYVMNFRNNDYLGTATDTRRFVLHFSPTYQATEHLSLGVSTYWYAYGGYEMKSANRNDVRMNATAAYKFLRNKAATLSFVYNDIFRVNNGFDTAVSGSQWSETRNFGKTSYAVIKFEYRFNVLR